jgi:hypothetical protein
VINRLRLPLGVPLGVMEIFLAALVLYAVFAGARLSSAYPSRRMHPALVVMLALMLLSVVTGTIMSFVSQITIDHYLRMLRELGAWPIYIFIGYRLMATPRSGTYFASLIVFCGVLMASILILNFRSNAESIEIDESYNAVRTVWYISWYSGMAAMILAYGMVTGDKLLPTIIAAPLACYCLAGQFAPLHRVEWMGIMFCFAALVVILPAGKRLATAIKGVGVLIVVLVFLVFMVHVVSSMTHRDFDQYVTDRLESLLPTERKTSKETKAWDTRTDSIKAELDMWLDSPLLGRGYGIQEDLVGQGKVTNWGAFHHNGWCSILAQTGIIGLAGFMICLVGMFVIGRKVVFMAPTKGMRLIGAMAVMGACYEFAEVLGAMAWTSRFALFNGVICGMAFRCYDMMEAVTIEQKLSGGDQHEEMPEPLPLDVEHVPAGF